MAGLLKLLDSILFMFILTHALALPLISAPSLLPQVPFPNFLIDFKNNYIRQSGDYLMAELPPFFSGCLWLELFFQWPLTLLNLYAIAAAKRLHTTCLIYGASVFSTMAAITAELIGSKRASNVLLILNLPFLGLGVLAMLRGLLPRYTTATAVATGNRIGPSIDSKKKA